jgi:hypothetical protein
MTVFLIILGVISALVLLALYVDVNFIFCLNQEPSVTVRVLCFEADAMTLAERLTSEKEEAETEPTPHKKARLTPEKALYLVKRLVELVKAVTRELCRCARLKICHIHISVATDDAAETARLYGTVSGIVWGLLEFLSHNMSVKRCDKKVLIIPDFTSTEPQLDMKLVLKIKPVHALGAVMHLLPLFTKRKVGTDNE